MKCKKGLILKEENGEAILFDPDSLLTAWLNKTGIIIWENLLKKSSENEIVDLLKNIYDAGETTIKNDVKIFVQDMLNKGFLIKEQDK